MGLKAYISNAGGFGAKAIKRRAYVVYANGTAKATRSFFGIKCYPKIKPGSEIVIPQRESKKGLNAVEIATFATSLTSILLISITLFKK
jgi:hypothetical protein